MPILGILQCFAFQKQDKIHQKHLTRMQRGILQGVPKNKCDIQNTL